MSDVQHGDGLWLVAQRGDQVRVFSRDEWKVADHGQWAVVVEGLTEEEATKEMVRRAPPEKRAP